MALEVFDGMAIPRELATAPMEFLWAKWKTLNSTNNLTLQRLLEESSYPLRDNCNYVMSAGDDFVYIYSGKNMHAANGRDLTGTLLSQSPNPLAGSLRDIYRQCVRKHAPVFLRYTGYYSQDGEIWQRLILPIRVSENASIIVVYSELISHKTEVFEHLFRTAPDAMIIACPIVNEVGHTTDGWVTMMNDRARTLLNFKERLTNLRLNDLPPFAGIDLWGRLYAPKGAVATPIDTAEFDVELMRFPNVFGLKIRPKLMPGVTLVPSADADFVTSEQ